MTVYPNTSSIRIFLWIFATVLILPFATAHADCSNPPGPEGHIIYNTTYKTMQFCDGTTWWNMKGGGLPAGCHAGDKAEYDGTQWRCVSEGEISLSECQPGETIIFNSSTHRAECPVDHTPDAYAFADRTDASPSAVTESGIIPIINMDDGLDISISGDGTPEYRICDDATCSSSPPYTNAAGHINSGQYVQLRLTSASSYDVTDSATLVIGDSTGEWTVTTMMPDQTPDSFSFSNQSNVSRSALITSNAVTVIGINIDTAVQVSGNGNPQININGTGWGTSGTIGNGQSLQTRLTSSSSFSTSSTATITIGTFSTNWTVQTGTGNCSTVCGTISNGAQWQEHSGVCGSTRCPGVSTWKCVDGVKQKLGGC